MKRYGEQAQDVLGRFVNEFILSVRSRDKLIHKRL